MHATASLAVNLAQHVIHVLANILRMGVESEIGAELLDQLQWFVADVDWMSANLSVEFGPSED